MVRTQHPAAWLPKGQGVLTTLLAVALLLPLGPALAAQGQSAGPSEATFLLQLVLLLLVGRAMGELMQRLGQPAVMGQLLAGILLGPSVLGALMPDLQHTIFRPDREQKSMLDAVAQLGILMLLLLTGMETDLSLVTRVRRAATSVSLTGISVPFACGFLLGQLMPSAMLPQPDERLIASLFLGTALSISSVKVVATVVREMNFLRRNVGQVILASAIIDDTLGWIIIAITFGLATQGGLDLGALAQTVIGTALFLALSFTFGSRLVFMLIRWSNDHLISDAAVITTILIVMGLMALITHELGVHTVLGAFVAGVLVGQSPILTRHIDEQLRGLIVALFMPVFFGLSGLSADLTILRDPELMGLTLGLILIASIGKFGGAFLGAWFGGLNRPEALALACGMNARGSTEVIVASIGLSMGVLNQNLYTMIVTMALVTTMAMPPMLRWALARLPMAPEEKARLEREAFEAKGFVSNLERLLLVADESSPGRFASRLVGLLAGSRGMPVTVLPYGPPRAEEERANEEKPRTSRVVAAAAAQAADRSAARNEERSPARVDVTTRTTEVPIEAAVADEARKGHDLMIIGLEEMTAAEGTLHGQVAKLADGFSGPLALVTARGPHFTEPENGHLHILVPVSGTDVSRRGAEFAIAIARATGASVLALYVISGGTTARRRRFALSLRSEEAVLKDIVGIADRYDVPIRTTIRIDIDAEDAILEEASRSGCNLIAMGVNRRPGAELFFGDVAAAVLDHAEQSIVYLAT